MNLLRSTSALVVPAALAVAMFATQPLHAELLEKTTEGGRHHRPLQGRPSERL